MSGSSPASFSYLERNDGELYAIILQLDRASHLRARAYGLIPATTEATCSLRNEDTTERSWKDYP